MRTGGSSGDWQPVDTTLVETNGVIKPRRVKGRLSLSSGEGKRLLTVMTGKGEAGIDWPGDLPRPQLHKDTATYTDAVTPGTDLVVRALPESFSLHMVIRERPKVRLAVRLPLALPEAMTYGRTKDGTPQSAHQRQDRSRQAGRHRDARRHSRVVPGQGAHRQYRYAAGRLRDGSHAGDRARCEVPRRSHRAVPGHDRG
ncbi:hypothetical protein [Streptomyces sp. SID1121]|uniref:hypothetical protein n=1 Tax=Streptomyces sp. SID1121 TaxID=3425888 RepID=UPI0040578E7B